MSRNEENASTGLLPLGTFVRVAARFPERAHVRTPYYVRGKVGRILALIGRYADPEILATGVAVAPGRTVYRVAFDSETLWGEGSAGNQHRVTVDLYDNWIEAWPRAI